MFTRLGRHIKDGYLGVKRHFGMALSSSTAVTITLLLIGIFMILTFNLNALTKEIESSISLSVLVDYSVTEESELNRIKVEISDIAGVSSVEFQSKEEEFDYYVSQYSDEEVVEFYELYRDDNPFHDAFLVGAENAEDLDSIKAVLLKIEGVVSVYDGGSNTYLLVDILENVRIFGGILVLALCFLAVYLIYNTIKITVASRETEIKIMKDVGALNSYIRAPFLVEGIIIGLMGSVLPLIILLGGYYYIYDVCGGVLLGVVTLIPVMPFIVYLGLMLLGLAIFVGFTGSYISVCRCLRGRR